MFYVIAFGNTTGIASSISATIGIGGDFASSGVGMIAFGTVSGGAGAALTGGNFWQGAATGLVVSGLNHYAHMIQIKNEIEEKYPGLYKVLSKLKTYVKDHPSVLESMSLYSGYSNKEILSLLSVGNLVNMVKVGGTDEWGQFFGSKDNTNIHISESLASSLDKGGFDYTRFKIFDNLNGRSFLAGVTVLHELVHYGRYWNGLPSLVGGKYEAGQMFEKRVFGLVLSQLQFYLLGLIMVSNYQ